MRSMGALFSKACSDKTRGTGSKVKDSGYIEELKFSMMRAVKHWESLPRDVADAPSPETSKVSWMGL